MQSIEFLMNATNLVETTKIAMISNINIELKIKTMLIQIL